MKIALRIVAILMLVVVGCEIFASTSAGISKHDHRVSQSSVDSIGVMDLERQSSDCHHHNPVLCESSTHCHFGYLPKFGFSSQTVSSADTLYVRPFDHALPGAPIIASLKRPPRA